ncbi:MAG: nucleotidyltransferase [Firmicutes bacterium]|nr:nucleotidyltransferase [Bacillota bacterium]
MKKKPVLVIMAAGMGSRYGGLKQMDPIGPGGELIIDFSLYDAKRAGFETAICIIKHEIEDDFKAIMNKGPALGMNILYAYQDMDDLPEGYTVPEDRKKPWGTGHAILAARSLIDSPFAVINADDYYGPGVFKTMFDYLSNAEDGEQYQYCMAGYRIENTLSENGSVARGVCVADESGRLVRIDERTNVVWQNGLPAFSEDGGESWTQLPMGTPVSMNFFGFTPSILTELQQRFPAALDQILNTNPVKGEFYIPLVTSDLVSEGKAVVTVLPAEDKWYGVTYREDRELVTTAMAEKKAAGLYPASLWK